MAVRVYRNLSVPSRATPKTAAKAEPSRRVRPSAPSQARATDGYDEPQADSHIIEHQARKENRAGRRELEAARRQLRQMREDEAHEHDEV
jgi:hypothetical protein